MMDELHTAHTALARACAGEHGEDPDNPETVQAMQIALHLPKTDPPARSDLLAAAARGVVKVCLDTRFLDSLRPWYDHRIRKVARRARNKAWRDVQNLPGVTVDDSGAQARVFPPSAVRDVHPAISKLQIGHTDLPYDEPGPADEACPVLYIDRDLDMTAGKAAAQAGHGSMLLAGAMPFEWVQKWAAADFPLVVREVPRAEFNRHCVDDGAVVVRDAGFTEIAPNSATVVAVPGR